MTMRSASYSLVIVALAFASMGGDCTLGGGGPGIPLRDCFTGLGTGGSIRVVIGGPTAMHRYGGSYPSCAGVDGLLPGTTLTLMLSKSSQPPCGGDRCYGYRTTSVGGLVGVTIIGGESDTMTGCGAFAYVRYDGGYFADAASGCSGFWEMALAPAVAPADTTTLSPFDAGSVHSWVIWREIGTIDNGTNPSCGSGPSLAKLCEDEFVVQSITKLSP